jgi:general secretion pathway protein G
MPHHQRPLARTRPQRRLRRAFTLVEMVVVVTIIALLAALIVPRLWSRLNFAKKNVAKAEVKQIENAVNMYLADTGVTLSSSFDLGVLLLRPDENGSPEGPYFPKSDALIDPWDHAYMIRVPGDINYDFDIISAGPDGETGTTDDIVN